MSFFSKKPNPQDPRDTAINGIVAGICLPVLCFFVLKALNTIIAPLIVKYWLNPYYSITYWQGFSLKFVTIISIAANFIPFRIFMRQRRDHALQGVIGTTLVLIGIAMYYFRSQFFGQPTP